MFISGYPVLGFFLWLELAPQLTTAQYGHSNINIKELRVIPIVTSGNYLETTRQMHGGH